MHQLPSPGSQLAPSRRGLGGRSLDGVAVAKANMTMNGLRVYIKGDAVETCGGCPVFYSRREDGPYYRWSYDESLCEWQVSRVLPSGFSPKMLALATRKKVPAGLEKSLASHYED